MAVAQMALDQRSAPIHFTKIILIFDVVHSNTYEIRMANSIMQIPIYETLKGSFTKKVFLGKSHIFDSNEMWYV